MINLFNGNDPQVSNLNNVHRSGFVYLHGPLEDLNSKLIEDNNWVWDAPDLFVQDEKFKLIGKYLIAESDSKHLDDVQSMPKLIVNEVDCTIFTKTHIDFYAIPCMFYGEKVIAFIKETITQTIYSDSGLLDPTEREIGSKSSHITGRVVLPYDDSLPTFTDSGDLIQDDKRDAWRHAVNHLDWM